MVPLHETTEFALAQEINHEPAFNWCIKHVLKRRDRIVASVRKWQTRYLKKSCKFGMKLPQSVEQVLTLDSKNGHTSLADAMSIRECQSGV